MTPKIVHKLANTSIVDGALNFIFSDENEDAYYDIIRAKGWRYKSFAEGNPIALFNHNKDWIVGRWTNVRVEGTQLKGQLILAPPGTSSRADEVRALVISGILKACSVGFRPISSRPRSGPNGGVEYLEQELLECSLVAVGANPSALLEAKKLGVSNEVIKMVFRAGNALAVAENIARSRFFKTYTKAERDAIHAKGKAMAKAHPSSKPKLIAMSDDLKSKRERALPSIARAKAVLRRLDEKEKREKHAYHGESTYPKWHGQIIKPQKWPGDE